MHSSAKRGIDEVSSRRGGKNAKAARKGSSASASARSKQALSAAFSAEDEKTRTKARLMLFDALSEGSIRGDLLVIANQVEQSVFTVNGGVVCNKYKQKAQAIKTNLTQNKQLRGMVLSGAMLPLHLAAMSSAEMASDDLKKKRNAAAEASLFDVVQSQEFLQLQKQAVEGAQRRKQDLIEKKKEEDEEERRAKEALELEEERRRAAREAEAAAHTKSIVAVGEDDVGCHYLSNAA